MAAMGRHDFLVVVFPKYFEKAKFLAELLLLPETTLIEAPLRLLGELITDPNLKFYIYQNGARAYPFLTWCSNQQDILFLVELFKLHSLLSKFKDGFGFEFLLVGTCGGIPHGGRIPPEIGSVLEIGAATKYDRGRIMKDGSIRFNPVMVATRCLTSQYQHHTLSGNYLVEDPGQYFHLEAYHCIEMETFEFFSFVNQFGYSTFGALRVVSDVVGGDYNERTRAAVSFAGVISPFERCLRQGRTHPLRLPLLCQLSMRLILREVNDCSNAIVDFTIQDWMLTKIYDGVSHDLIDKCVSKGIDLPARYQRLDDLRSMRERRY